MKNTDNRIAMKIGQEYNLCGIPTQAFVCYYLTFLTQIIQLT